MDGGALQVRLGDLAHVERRLGPLLVAAVSLDEPIVVERLDRRQLGAARAAAVAAQERRHPRGRGPPQPDNWLVVISDPPSFYKGRVRCPYSEYQSAIIGGKVG